MSAHPSDDALFAAATGADPEARAHARDCPFCAVRYGRLQAGARILESARRANSPQVNWRAIDDKVMAAAQQAATDIRRGVLRPQRRSRVPVYVGIALAAAAAGVLAFRAGLVPHRTRSGISRALAQMPASGGGPRASQPSMPVEGVVLLAAAPASYNDAGARAAPIGANTVVREGGRIVVDEHRGRAIIALHAGYRLDVRPAGEITFRKLRTDETAMVLTKGEVRVDGPAREDTRVALEVSGWTLISKGGSFTASLEGEVIRVRVLSGKISVRRGEGEARDVFARDELELGKQSPLFRVVSRDSRDASALDLSFLAPESAGVVLPALPAGATLSLLGGGALPEGLSVLRVRGPVDLEARRGEETWLMRIEGSVSTPQWQPRTRVVASAPQIGSGTLGGTGRRIHAPAPQRGASQLAVPAAPSSGGSGQTMIVTVPRQEIDAVRAAQRVAATRMNSCVSRCELANNCSRDPEILVTVDIDPEGHVTDARTRNFADSPSLQQCVLREARMSPWPRFSSPTSIELRLPNAYRRER